MAGPFALIYEKIYMEMHMFKRILICYVPPEQTIAKQLISDLKARNIGVTSYPDQPYSQPPNGLQQIDGLIILLSDSALMSGTLRSVVTTLIDQGNGCYPIVSLYLSPSSLLNEWDILHPYPSLLWYPGGYDDIFTRLLESLGIQTPEPLSFVYPMVPSENTLPALLSSDLQSTDPIIYQSSQFQREGRGNFLTRYQIVGGVIAACALLFIVIIIVKSATDHHQFTGASSSIPSFVPTFLVPTEGVPSPTLTLLPSVTVPARATVTVTATATSTSVTRTSPTPTITNSGTNGSRSAGGYAYTYVISTANSTTVNVSFTTHSWTAGYVILHYIVSSESQQNVYMTNSANTWTYSVPISSGRSLTYSFTFYVSGLQYDTATSTWTCP
jgi:hypothetical protein